MMLTVLTVNGLTGFEGFVRASLDRFLRTVWQIRTARFAKTPMRSYCALDQTQSGFMPVQINSTSPASSFTAAAWLMKSSRNNTVDMP